MALSGTRDFFELVKAIGESKSKQEEDRIIAEEVFSNMTLQLPFDRVLFFYNNMINKQGCLSEKSCASAGDNEKENEGVCRARFVRGNAGARWILRLYQSCRVMRFNKHHTEESWLSVR